MYIQELLQQTMLNLPGRMAICREGKNVSEEQREVSMLIHRGGLVSSDNN